MQPNPRINRFNTRPINCRRIRERQRALQTANTCHSKRTRGDRHLSDIIAIRKPDRHAANGFIDDPTERVDPNRRHRRHAHIREPCQRRHTIRNQCKACARRGLASYVNPKRAAI